MIDYFQIWFSRISSPWADVKRFCTDFHLFNISTDWDYYLCFTMIKLIFYGLVVYLIYKLVFELIIPVSKATSQMSEKVRQMHQQQQQFQQQQAKQATEPQKAAKASSDKDYIEYEEVKS
jgi:hypothetical protein